MEEVKQILQHKPSPLMVGDDPRKSDKIVRLGDNRGYTCYIVAGLVISEGKVLLIQEAKRTCRGKWYIPAGRVERNESLEDAVRREVKEEAGVDFEPLSLIGIESQQSYRWLRFTFTGRITGGNLKTPEQEDEESIQAQWIPLESLNTIPIRADDCMKVIQLANEWYGKKEEERYSRSVIPASSEWTSMRIILIHRSNGDISVLLRDTPAGNTSLPGAPLASPSIGFDIQRVLNSAGYKASHDFIGTLSVEHLVSGGDGIGFTALVEAKEAELQDGCGFHWEVIGEGDVQGKIRHFLDNKMATIAMSY